MARLRVGLLSKKRGNFALQERFRGPTSVRDTTALEVEHHQRALAAAGYDVVTVAWDEDIQRVLRESAVDIVFNVSSLVEAAVLEELGLPFVGSGTPAIAVSLQKDLAKRLWLLDGLPTSPFVVVDDERRCDLLRDDPAMPFPLFVKPVAGRGSAGVDASSIVTNDDELRRAVRHRLVMIGQPVLVERYLQGREITLGVVGNAVARVLPPLEISYRQGDATLSFEKKEIDDDAFHCPARLEEAEWRTLKALALRAYRVLGLRDFGRIDTILTPKGPFLLEANAFAGLMCTPRRKPHSYMGFMARAEGKDGAALLGEIVAAAVARGRERGR